MIEPVCSVDSATWMKVPEVLKLIKTLGSSDEIRFVGGCVRNMLLHKPVGDIDLATVHTPEAVMERLQSAGIKVVPTGIAHGTVTAVIKKQHFEITTLRRDVETDGRRAVVSYTDDWAEDARRRDFTMNTLLADPEGNIYDPTGRGVADLKAGRVVFVGDPDQRIAEDYLRILRFFRFHAYYGSGDPDPLALKACRDAADQIRKLSRERITQEFFKILSAEDPAEVLDLMFAQGVLKTLDFAEYNSDVLQALCVLQNRFGQIETDGLAGRIAVLAGAIPDNLERIYIILTCSKQVQRKIEYIGAALKQNSFKSVHNVQEAMYRFGRDASAQALLIQKARGEIDDSFLEQALEIIRDWEVPVFSVTGEDLMARGYAQGLELGQKLKELEEKWIREGFQCKEML